MPNFYPSNNPVLHHCHTDSRAPVLPLHLDPFSIELAPSCFPHRLRFSR